MMFTQELTKVEDSGDSSPYSDGTSPETPESPDIPEKDSGWLDPHCTLKKTIIAEGISLKCPRDGSECVVLIEQQNGPSLSGLQCGFKLNEACSIVVGECDSAVGRSLEKVLMTMKTKEVSEVVCVIKKEDFLEIENGQSESTALDANIELTYKIELCSFVEQPDIHQLEKHVKLERAAHHKNEGVKLFQNGFVRAAFFRFSKAAKLLIFLSPEDYEEKTILQLACYLNMAACQLQTGAYEHVVENCTKVLNEDASNVKGYYRRGVAYLNLKDYDKSREDLRKVIDLDPKNEAAKQKLRVVINEKKKLDQYYAKQMSKLFG